MFPAVQLHDVLLLAREQFYLDLIQGYLKGRQSIFKERDRPIGCFQYNS